jgi:F-type H+-transporting ATPase subunit a
MRMIESLFETFDPLIRVIAFNLRTLIIALILPYLVNYYNHNTRKIIFWNIIEKIIFRELRASITNNNKKIKVIFLLTIFLYFLVLNLWGLVPYVYTITRQMLLTLRVSLPFWLSFVIFRITHNINHFLRHLVPLSSPLVLSQFIVIIESISQIIRPITLSVRLCANITAGHILIALARKPIIILNVASRILFILIILEFAVAIIQSYVFRILLSIYLRETTYAKTISPIPHYFPQTMTLTCRIHYNKYACKNNYLY